MTTFDVKADGDTTKGHVLTEQEAFSLLMAVHRYFRDTDAHVGGRHRTEIVAEEMVKDGKASLATDVLHIHGTMQDFHRGSFKEAMFFGDSPVFEGFVEASRGTRFAESVDHIVRELKIFGEVINEKPIDWAKSADVLAKVKRDKYPEDLTMIEKLDRWQQEGPAVGR